jgi:hypothetical protein
MEAPYYGDRTSWSQLYTAIFNDIARRAETEDIRKEQRIFLGNKIILGVLKKAIREKGEKTEPLSKRKAIYNSNGKREPVLINCVKELHLFGRCFTSHQKKKHLNRSTQRDRLFTPLCIVDRKPCVEVCGEELSALSIVLGVPLKFYTPTFLKGEGAFGTSLTASLDHSSTQWQLHFNIGSRIAVTPPLWEAVIQYFMLYF